MRVRWHAYFLPTRVSWRCRHSHGNLNPATYATTARLVAKHGHVPRASNFFDMHESIRIVVNEKVCLCMWIYNSGE